MRNLFISTKKGITVFICDFGTFLDSSLRFAHQ